MDDGRSRWRGVARNDAPEKAPHRIELFSEIHQTLNRLVVGSRQLGRGLGEGGRCGDHWSQHRKEGRDRLVARPGKLREDGVPGPLWFSLQID